MNKMPNQHYLAVSLLGEKVPSLLEKFTKIVAQKGCRVIKSKVSSLGSEYALHVLMSGDWSAIAKIESQLQMLQNRFDVRVFIKRTNEEDTLYAIPYHVEIVALERCDAMAKITEFFIKQDIPIDDIHCHLSTVKNKYSIMNISIQIFVGTSINISHLREVFIAFCEDYNLDGSLEPISRNTF